jgi:hypothetical protein
VRLLLAALVIYLKSIFLFLFLHNSRPISVAPTTSIDRKQHWDTGGIIYVMPVERKE